ncbi:MAG: peptidoglycan editing factor PgeF [Acidobacteriaceae bacterium]|nr:peptidoglycan editing factor PgeF [Acidobacteriaceae bacterium]
MGGIQILKAPEWNFAWLRHGFSTRSGGESVVYGGKTLNLGWTKEDDPKDVAENRKRFVDAVAGSSAAGLRLVTIRQVHSGAVLAVRAEDARSALETTEGRAVLEGDGLITNVPNLLLAVGTADCVPVLVVDPVRQAVGAFHAGWRGTVASIAEHGIRAMQREYGSQPADLMAAIGPAVGACCYVVDEDVRAVFGAAFSYAEELFQEIADSPDNKKLYYLDLWQANRRQLQDAGLLPERIATVGGCTACSHDSAGERVYFSHRAERGATGRMLSAVGVMPI